MAVLAGLGSAAPPSSFVGSPGAPARVYAGDVAPTANGALQQFALSKAGPDETAGDATPAFRPGLFALPDLSLPDLPLAPAEILPLGFGPEYWPGPLQVARSIESVPEPNAFLLLGTGIGLAMIIFRVHTRYRVGGGGSSRTSGPRCSDD